MIAYCTHCWTEIDSFMAQCPKCGADLTLDQRSYEEKIVGALKHPIPEARVRACLLIGTNQIDLAAGSLIHAAQMDEDLFVRRAAVEALGHLHAPEVLTFLVAMAESDDPWLCRSAKESLARLHAESER